MPLDFQTVDVRFDKGLDTKTNPKLVIPGKWTQLDNFSLSKETTLRRRDGIAALAPNANGNGLATRNDELLTLAGPTLSSFSPATATVNARTGTVGNVLVAKNEIRRALGLQVGLDCAASVGGYTCYVWNDLSATGAAAGISMTLVEEATGAQVISGLQLTAAAGAVSPRVVCTNHTFFIFWVDSNSGTAQLKCRCIDVNAAPTVVGTEVVLVSDANLINSNIDAIQFGDFLGSTTDSCLVTLRYFAPGVASVQAVQVIHAGTVPSVLSGPVAVFADATVPHASIKAVTCVAFSATIAGIFVNCSIAAGAFAGVTGATISSTGFTVLTAATQLDGGGAQGESHVCGVAVGGNVTVFADAQDGYGTSSMVIGFIRQTTVSPTLTIVVAGAYLARAALFRNNAAEPAGLQGPFIHGKPFVSGGTVFLPTCVMENWASANLTSNTATVANQSTLLLYNCTTLQVVAKALAGTYGPPGAVGNNAPIVGTPVSCPLIADSTTSFSVPAYERTFLSLVGGVSTSPRSGAQNVSPSGVCRVSMTVNTTLAQGRTQLGQSTFIAGGNLTSYDGANLVEHGFPIFPEGISVVGSGAGGTMTAGVHSVAVLYEWVDNSGQRHQSGVCVPVSVTVSGATSSLTVKVPTLLVSQKTGVTVVAYMTAAGGTTFYRVTPLTAPVANTTATATVTLTITAADASITSNEILYSSLSGFTGGNALPNHAPNPCNTISVHQNRLFFDRADQPFQFGYSQQFVDGLGLQFNEALGGEVDATSGGVVGFASIDEKVIIFCARKPYVMFGQGANALGSYATYSDPVEIPCDVGCSDARSILKMPTGIIFKSQKGWYLMGRDLVARYIGAGVAQYDTNAVSSAVLLADRQECRFGSSSGTQLTYAYEISDPDGDGQWSTATVQGISYGVADALWWPAGGYYVHITGTQGLNQDTPGSFAYDQPGNAGPIGIVTTARTSFLHVSKMGGFQRVRWLYWTMSAAGQPASTLNVAVAFNDDYTSGYNFNVLLSAINVMGDVPVDLRHKLERQKCKSVALTFTETPDPGNLTPTLRGMQSLALEVGLKKGTNRLPAAQGVS